MRLVVPYHSDCLVNKFASLVRPKKVYFTEKYIVKINKDIKR